MFAPTSWYYVANGEAAYINYSVLFDPVEYLATLEMNTVLYHTVEYLATLEMNTCYTIEVLMKPQTIHGDKED
jgi:hypothetical protein